MLKCRRNVPGLPVIRQDRDMEQCQNFTVTHDSGGVATVSFDMPGRRYNVLTEQAFLELEQIANHLADSPAVRCVVFSSGKDSGFVAGADLKELSALPNAECAAQLVSLGQRVFDRIEALAIPTVAVIHGPCLGGGLEFALACKYRAACDEPSTRLGTPEVKLGLMPAWGGIQRLPERVGLEAALRLLWLGRAVSARQALEMGLVDLLWPRDVFQEGVEHFVSALATQRTVEIPDTSAGWAANGDPQEIPDAVRSRLNRGRHGPALPAMLEVLEQWRQGGRAAGSAAERELFPKLLFSEHGRRRLARFFKRLRVSRSRPWVEGLTLGAALRRTAAKFPDSDAMVFLQAAMRMTWAEFDRKVDRVARGLLALGLRRGDHFGVWSTNWPEWVLLQFATARIGVVMATINPSYRAAELQYTLAQSDVRGLRSSNGTRAPVTSTCCGKSARKWLPPSRESFMRPRRALAIGGPHARLRAARHDGVGRTGKGRRGDRCGGPGGGRSAMPAGRSGQFAVYFRDDRPSQGGTP